MFPYLLGKLGLNAQRSESIVQGPKVTDHGGVTSGVELVVVPATVVTGIEVTLIVCVVVKVVSAVALVVGAIVVGAAVLGVATGAVVVGLVTTLVLDMVVVLGAVVGDGVVPTRVEMQSFQPGFTME